MAAKYDVASGASSLSGWSDDDIRADVHRRHPESVDSGIVIIVPAPPFDCWINIRMLPPPEFGAEDDRQADMFDRRIVL